MTTQPAACEQYVARDTVL